uniref:FZ domain-containing protein n=1 Tax=Branchiostoma floridae TaxID=7739 RepID=C3Z0N1_BRAFL|eukprot:XP_002597899.1 hypothetical protein BRAFLDRAFT_97886 [Branchiostoma floridae]
MGLSYSQTSFPNLVQWPNQDYALLAAPTVFPTYDPISDCHPDLNFFLCSIFFPQCTSEGQIFPCRSFCNKINATCGERALAAGVQWNASLCAQLPEDSCSVPNECEPIQYSGCMGLSYSQTSFPNLVQWQDQGFALQTAPFLFPTYDPISDCHPDLNFFLCSIFFPQCTSEGQIGKSYYICGHNNSTAKYHHHGECISLVKFCNRVPDCSDGSDEASCISNEPLGVCLPITPSAEYICTHLLPYANTSLPNYLNHVSQTQSLQAASVLNQASGCHPSFTFLMCTTVFPKCEDDQQIQLCMSVCEEINVMCSPVGLGLPFSCNVFPDQNSDPGCFTVEQCEPIRYSRCMGLSYSQTSFPNLVQWPTQDVALQTAPTVFPAYDPISDCHPDLNFFLCSIFFPQCTSDGQIFPCRSFCYEINATCGERALAAGIEWDAFICSRLSEDSCSLPNATSATTPAVNVTIGASNTTQLPSTTTRGGIGSGGIAGIVIGVLAAVALAAAAAYILIQKKPCARVRRTEMS